MNVVVIGGTSGYGAAIAENLAASGNTVFIGSRTTTPRCDVRDEESVEAFFEQFNETEAGLGLGAVVYSAGIARHNDTIIAGDPDEWQNVFQTNTLGLLRVARHAIPRLDRFGTFIHIGSIAAFFQYEGGVDYCASKAAANSIMRGLRLETVRFDVRVTTIEPGLGDTEFQLSRYDGDIEKAARHFAGIRQLDPHDVARAVAFVITQPAHVNIDEIIIKPTDQATHGKTKAHDYET